MQMGPAAETAALHRFAAARASGHYIGNGMVLAPLLQIRGTTGRDSRGNWKLWKSTNRHAGDDAQMA